MCGIKRGILTIDRNVKSGRRAERSLKEGSTATYYSQNYILNILRTAKMHIALKLQPSRACMYMTSVKGWGNAVKGTLMKWYRCVEKREKHYFQKLGARVKTIKHQGQKRKVAKGRMLKTTNILQRQKAEMEEERLGVRNRKEGKRRLETILTIKCYKVVRCKKRKK